MKKNIILLSALFFIVISCKDDDIFESSSGHEYYQKELQALVNEHWDDFVDGRDNFPGGYAPETDITYVMYVNVWDFSTFSFDVFTELTNLYGVAYAAKDILTK